MYYPKLGQSLKKQEQMMAAITKLYEVACGDWIYPSRDSSTSVRYPTDFPLVAEIFLPQKEAGKRVVVSGRINQHLHGPRFLEISVDDEQNKLHIIALKNRAEEKFAQQVNFEVNFDHMTLTRTRTLPNASESDYVGIFFTDVLLQAYLAGKPLPKEIIFRKATIPEIESLGKW